MSSSVVRKLIHVKVISDILCPWCFVGKRHLEEAMRLSASKYDFEVEWKPYFLIPTPVPPEGIDKDEHLMRKYRVSPERLAMMHARLAAAGHQAGIEFKPHGRVYDSLPGHRLTAWALKQGGTKVQNNLMEELFKLNFEKQANIADAAVLADAAQAAGLDREAALSFLKTDELTAEVRREAEQYMGAIGGVPFFIFENKFVLEGAQPVPAFRVAFDRASAVADPTAHP